MKQKKRVLQYFIMFCVSLVLMQILFHLPFIMEPFMYLTTYVTSSLLRLFGYSIVMNQFHIIGAIDMEIIYECTGVYGVIIYFSGIIASWFPWDEKVKASFLGLAILFFINQIRLVSMFIISSQWPFLFDILHTYFWQFFLVLFVCYLYYSWFKNMTKRYPLRHGD